MKKKDIQEKKAYHHGNLAESLLNAVDELATQFGLEAVTLRGCAKRVGVSPSSAFRHYADKRALLTAFATRALLKLSDTLSTANKKAHANDGDPFVAVGMAYVRFAIDKPAYFRAMWRQETIYTDDERYQEAAATLSANLNGGFADTLHDSDPDRLSEEELLAWSAVHGLANLIVDGPIGNDDSRKARLQMAEGMIERLKTAFA